MQQHPNVYERRGGQDSTDAQSHLENIPASLIVSDKGGIETEGPTANIKQALSEEAFMAERLTIALHSPQTEDDPMYVQGGVNGELFSLFRDENVQHEVKRSWLAVIAQARTGRLKQVAIRNSDGSRGYSETIVSLPAYPFSVIHDPNPRGPSWLRRILTNA
jgi:hypothetical protein